MNDRMPLSILQRHLAGEARTRRATEAALRCSLASPCNPPIGDAISARITALLMHVAGCVLRRSYREAGETISDLAARLAEDGTLLRRLHAIALEFVLGERLRARLGLDPVSPPLVLSWLADGSEHAGLAARLVQSQAIFVEAQRRMELTEAEFPYDLISVALKKAGRLDDVRPLRGPPSGSDNSRAVLLREAAVQTSGAPDLLDMGVALFLSAVADAAGTERDEVTLALSPGQHARFALLLVVAGLPPTAIEHAVSLVHGPSEQIASVAAIDAETAAAILREGS